MVEYSNLSFKQLRDANLSRLPDFKGCTTDGYSTDWSLNDWMTALTGEVGEAANILKKVRRSDFTLEEAKPSLSKELGDIQTYLDILASQCGIDLADATTSKFNEVSSRIGSTVYLYDEET